MVQWWKSLRLQARFMALTGIGVLILAACALALVSWFEVSSLKQRFRSAAENELKSLAALVESAMEQRLNDQENVAIKVFNGWFESRNKEYSGKLWSVWSPKVTAYMAQTEPERAAKKPLDGIDQEALRTGLPVERFAGGTYRYSLPIVLGRNTGTQTEVCAGCHTGGMGLEAGEVIAVFSTSVPTTGEFAALYRLLLIMAAGMSAAAAFAILGIRLILGQVIARPLGRMTEAMLGLAGGDETIHVPAQHRKDEIGEMAGAVRVFKEHMIEAQPAAGGAKEYGSAHRGRAQGRHAAARCGVPGRGWRHRECRFNCLHRAGRHRRHAQPVGRKKPEPFGNGCHRLRGILGKRSVGRIGIGGVVGVGPRNWRAGARVQQDCQRGRDPGAPNRHPHRRAVAGRS